MSVTSRVLVVIGTRPEAIKLGPVIRALRTEPDAFDTSLCVTGQHREMLEPILRLFGLVPDHDLHLMTPNQTLAGLTSHLITSTSAVVEAERPDWVVVQGDTTTALGASLAAFYKGVRIAHVEAGLRTSDKRNPFPEEANRRMVDLDVAPLQSRNRLGLFRLLSVEKVLLLVRVTTGWPARNLVTRRCYFWSIFHRL